MPVGGPWEENAAWPTTPQSMISWAKAMSFPWSSLVSYAAHPIRVVGEMLDSLIGTERAAVASVWHGNQTWAAWVVSAVLAEEGRNYSLTNGSSPCVPRAVLYKRAAAPAPVTLHAFDAWNIQADFAASAQARAAARRHPPRTRAVQERPGREESDSDGFNTANSSFVESTEAERPAKRELKDTKTAPNRSKPSESSSSGSSGRRGSGDTSGSRNWNKGWDIVRMVLESQWSRLWISGVMNIGNNNNVKQILAGPGVLPAPQKRPSAL